MKRFSKMKNEADQFSFIRINDAGSAVVKELVVIENQVSGKYELFYKKDLESYKKIWASTEHIESIIASERQ